MASDSARSGVARASCSVPARSPRSAAASARPILASIDLHRLHGLSFWDALVVRAAKQAGCGVLLTEDLQDGREIDGVRIVDPFRNRAPKIRERASSYQPRAARARSR